MSKFTWQRAWPAYASALVLAVLLFGTVAFALAIHWHISIAQGFVLAGMAQFIAVLAHITLDGMRERRAR